MRFPRHTKVFRGQLDPAAFAGVFFLLIIFIMLQSSLVFTPGVPIRLPQAMDLPGLANPTVLVAVDRAGQLYFDNQVTDEARLKQQLQAEAARHRDPMTLVIHADRETQYELLVRLALLARDVGIPQALLATRPETIPAGALAAPR